LLLAALARLAAAAWDNGLTRVRAGDAAATAALTRFGLVAAVAQSTVGAQG
jgi:hypothetical protein